MKNIKVISFDLDETLVDKDFDMIIWYTEIPRLYSEKYKIPFEEAKIEVVSEYKRLKDHHRWTDIEFWFDHFGLKDWRKLMDGLKYKIRLYPDSIPLLEKMKKDFKLIIITQAERKFIELKIKVENLGKYFLDIFSTASDFKQLEKSEAIYLKILEKLKIKPEELVHIGDHYDFDYKVPRKLGINAFLLDRSGEKKGENMVHSLREFKDKIYK
ncbi:HAD family hydrolase [Candidatus Woesearchaeota archaeon]|nr:HAD family hydrolase [Candidatus Woesearchaeota archaeon]